MGLYFVVFLEPHVIKQTHVDDPGRADPLPISSGRTTREAKDRSDLMPEKNANAVAFMYACFLGFKS